MIQDAITHYRLHSQQIAHARCQKPDEVVAKLGAMQAQDYSGALWAIGLRLPKAIEADIEKAIADRTIIRTWPMRGTLHFVAAADIHWILKFLTPRIIAGAARRYQELELNDATLFQCEKIFTRALQGGNQLTRAEMFALLEDAKIPVNDQRGYHILWRLAQERILCFGARKGKQQTFTLLEEWVPNASKLEREEALAVLALRYFSSHGPSALQDFAWWSGLKVSDARAGLAGALPKLIKETINGKDYWMSPDSPTSGCISASVFLLPGFDEYMLGYQDRSAALDPQYAQRIVPGGNGMFLPTVVSNGRVVSTWKRDLKKKSVAVIAAPFTPLEAATNRLLAEASERYARYLNLPLATG